jgi:hypothetical protein
MRKTRKSSAHSWLSTVYSLDNKIHREQNSSEMLFEQILTVTADSYGIFWFSRESLWR